MHVSRKDTVCSKSVQGNNVKNNCQKIPHHQKGRFKSSPAECILFPPDLYETTSYITAFDMLRAIKINNPQYLVEEGRCQNLTRADQVTDFAFVLSPSVKEI